MKWFWQKRREKAFDRIAFAPTHVPNIQTLGDIRRLIANFADCPDDCPAKFVFTQVQDFSVTLEVLNKPTKQGE